ncbi:formylmethanofuran dehydrogenase subunit A [Candidatus Bathyarchaeota archaeon]|nr:MAG: formylmethanofuran dehydrogenase subunit A [Candidatus Bathyarchaeota archaeon]
MVAKLLIKNGFVYDPLNGVDGEVMDIAIENGKIVEDVSGSDVKVIDASGMVVMPGGVDIHSHIAGSKVNSGRALRPEDHYGDYEPRRPGFRSGVGYTVPSTFTIGYRYVKMGYTTVFEPATPMLKQKHTIEELNDIPILDKASFPLVGDCWFVLEYLEEGKLKECAAYIAWLLKAIKGYALKIVNPGGLEAWGWGRNVEGLDDQIPGFSLTPRELVRGLCRVNKMLNLPHPIHVHANRLGRPGNYTTLIETMDCVRDLYEGDKPVIYLTHCQFNSYTGESWIDLGSGAAEVADYVNKHPHVLIDIGQVIFSEATTMTADGPFQFQLHLLTDNKWINADVEAESTAGIVPFRFRRKNYVHAVQWITGLELALSIKDPWRMFLTTDHPNAGPFTEYPRVIAWLISRRAREATIKRVNGRAIRRSILESLDREYSLYEIAVITRAGTAKALGLESKGHLGVGADADVAVYDINPRELDISRDYRRVRRAFRRAAYTIKAGEIVCVNGELVKNMGGSIYWVKPSISSDLEESVVSDIRRKFREYYTVEFENYLVGEEYLPRSVAIEVEGGV